MDKKYLRAIIAIAITIGLIAVAYIVGDVVAGTNLSTLNSQLQNYQQQISEIQLALSIGPQNSTISCGVAKNYLSGLSTQIGTLGNEVNAMDLENQNGPSYNYAANQLFYLRLSYWLLGDRIRDQCGGATTTVLFFYEPKNCDACTLEGNELSYISSKAGNFIYSGIDGVFNNSVITALDATYNISTYPAIVINDKYVVSGIQTTQQLLTYLCADTGKAVFCNSSAWS